MNPSRAEPLQAARTMLGLTHWDLWVDYVGLGGSLLPDSIRTFLDGHGEVSDHDHDIIVQALNEHFIDNDADHPLAYADELSPP